MRLAGPTKRGFSLLEMTVVIAIVGIMTAIVLFNLPQMRGGLSIDLVAQEVAIYIRGAQVYSRATKVAANDPVYSSFGVHFTTGSNKYFLWTDTYEPIGTVDGTVYYFQSGEGADFDQRQENYELPAGFSFDRLTTVGADETGAVDQDWLDIVFRKPDPEANIACPNGADAQGLCAVAAARICLISPNQAQERVIEVYSNGQIAVRRPAAGVCNSTMP